MSALTDLFSAMANKIRSKTGTATTYTPSEMVSDGIDDVYDAGVASVPTPTSITPSNSSPVSLTANTAVKPTASGYAIESYAVKTPTSNVVYAVVNGEIYKMGADGYLIKSYSTITPSNSSPVSLSGGSFFTPAASGYAIKSYSSETPSDASPASVSSGAIIKASSSGYLVKNTPVDLSTPDLVSNADMSASGTRTISVTQKPRYIVCVMTRYGSSQTDGRCYISLVDVARNTSRKVERGSSAYDSGTTQSGLTDNVTAVSASSVTIKNAVSVTVRSLVMIYY